MRFPYLGFWLGWIRNERELDRFSSTDPKAKRIVIFADSAEDWSSVEPIMLELIHNLKESLCYVTVSSDPIRHMPPLRIHPFFLDSERVKRRFLEQLSCETLLVCSPSAMKKPFPFSPKVKCYAYLFPDLSTVRGNICQENLKIFQMWLCAAEHQMLELLRLKGELGLTYRVFASGSSRFDRTMRTISDSPKRFGDPIPTVFFAFYNPSLELRQTVCLKVINQLLSSGFRVIFRPPKQWLDRKGTRIRPLYEAIERPEHFFPEGEQPSRFSVYRSDLLITDALEWAMELGLALQYPVVLLDTGDGQGSSSAAHDIFSQIGQRLPISSLDVLSDVCRRCLSRQAQIAADSKQLRDKLVLNPGQAALTAAMILAGKTLPGQPIQTPDLRL